MSKLTGVALLMVSLTASAGVVITQEHGDFGGKEKMKSVLYLEGGKIRVESTQANGQKTTMIFDGDKQVLWMLQPDRGEYMEMTRANVEAMSEQMAGLSQQMAGMNQQMAQAMAHMTPEQRAAMEQMMKQRGGAMPGMAAPAAPKTITFEARGGSDKVGQFTCTKYDELSNGTKTAELCAASTDQISLKEADMRAFQALGKFMEPLAKMGRGGWTAPPVQQLHGFPVRTVGYDGARPTYEMKVISVEQKSVDASMFVVPAGLKKQEMPMMGGRGRN